MPEPKQRPCDRLCSSIAQSMGGRIDGAAIVAKCYGVLHEMLENRNLRVTSKCQTAEVLLQRIDDGTPVLAARDDSESPSVLVFIDTEDRTGVKLVRTLREQNMGSALIVINVEGATHFTKREVCDVDDIEFWMFRELLMNPTSHCLVPKHTALDADAAKRLCTDICVLPEQFPLLLETDIIARWYRFARGTIVKIERKGLAHESGVYYRQVR